MPRLTERNPKYRKHRASGQAVVTINSKETYLGPWNTKASKAQYDRLIGEWLANGRQRNDATSDLKVGELIRRFWCHAEAYYRRPDGTPSGETSCFKKPLALLNRLYGPTLARDFGPLALEVIRTEMVREKWCRNYINAQVARLKMVFKWAVSKELVPASVHHALVTIAGLRAGRTTAKESEPVRPVADEVVEATLPHLSSVVAAMVQLQRLTGARPGEVCQIRTAEIDSNGEVWTYTPATHKTAHHGFQRTIPLGPKAQAVVKPFLKPLNPQAFIFSPKDADNERREALRLARQTPLSCGNVTGSNRKARPRRQPGDVYDVAAYRRAIARACDLAFPPPAELLEVGREAELSEWLSDHRWHPHQLRHSAATDIRKRFGIEAAQNMLGHATLSVTEIYAERNSAAARQIAAVMG